MGNQNSQIPPHSNHSHHQRPSYYSVEYLNGSGVESGEENLTNYSASSFVDSMPNFSKHSKKTSISLGNLDKISEPITRQSRNMNTMASKMVLPNSSNDETNGTSNLMSLVRSGGVLVQRNKAYAKAENQVLPIGEANMRQLKETKKRQTEIKIGDADLSERDLIKPSLIKSLIVQSRKSKREPDATSNDECSDFGEDKSVQSSPNSKFQSKSMHDIDQWDNDEAPKSSIDLRDEIFTELGISCKVLHLDNDKLKKNGSIVKNKETSLKRRGSLREEKISHVSMETQKFKSMSLSVQKSDERNVIKKDDEKRDKKKLKSKSFLSQLKSSGEKKPKETTKTTMKLVDKIKSIGRHQPNQQQQQQPKPSHLAHATSEANIEIISRFPINSKVYRHYIAGNKGLDKLTNSISLANMVKKETNSAKTNDLIEEEKEEEEEVIHSYCHNERAIDVIDAEVKKSQTEPVYDSIEEFDSTKNKNNEVNNKKEEKIVSSTSSLSSPNSLDTPSSTSSISQNAGFYFKEEVDEVGFSLKENQVKSIGTAPSSFSPSIAESSGRTTASSVCLSSPSNQTRQTFVSSINITYQNNQPERSNSSYEFLTKTSSQARPAQNLLVSTITITPRVDNNADAIKAKKSFNSNKEQKRLNEIFQDEIERAYEERTRRFNEIKKALRSDNSSPTQSRQERFVNVVQIRPSKHEEFIKQAKNHYLEDNLPRFYLRPQQNLQRVDEHEVKIEVPLDKIERGKTEPAQKFKFAPSRDGLVRVLDPSATYKIGSNQSVNENIYGEIDLGIRLCDEIKKEANFILKSKNLEEEKEKLSEPTTNSRCRRKALKDVFPELKLNLKNEEKKLKMSKDWCPAADLNAFDDDDDDDDSDDYPSKSFEYSTQRLTEKKSLTTSSEELEEFFFRPCAIEPPAFHKQPESRILSNLINKRQVNSSFRPVLPKSQIPKLSQTAFKSLELIDELEWKFSKRDEAKLMPGKIYRNEIRVNNDGLITKIDHFDGECEEATRNSTFVEKKKRLLNQKNPLYSSDSEQDLISYN